MALRPALAVSNHRAQPCRHPVLIQHREAAAAAGRHRIEPPVRSQCSKLWLAAARRRHQGPSHHCSLAVSQIQSAWIEANVPRRETCQTMIPKLDGQLMRAAPAIAASRAAESALEGPVAWLLDLCTSGAACDVAGAGGAVLAAGWAG